MVIINELESNVRYYSRIFPDTFVKAKGSKLFNDKGKEYIDFFSGAGVMNYGHNNDYIKKQVLSYIESDNIMHGLDMITKAKIDFMSTFKEKILGPRNLSYKIQFSGPTGSNAVEAALRLAKKVKGRNNIFAFMGGFHGLTQGSLAVTSKLSYRSGLNFQSGDVKHMPYPYEGKDNIDTIKFIESILEDEWSGIEKPAAIIFETVQAEGGVIVAPVKWIKDLKSLCEKHDILLICDEIQVGCHRTGPYFSFEKAEIIPDIVVMSKSLSGYGFPMSIVLVKPEYDFWNPGEYTSTFRGNQLAFVSSKASIELIDRLSLEKVVSENESFVKDIITNDVLSIDGRILARGRGMIWGIDLSGLKVAGLASKVTNLCFKNGLLIEFVGRNENVLKFLPPLTTDKSLMKMGFDIIRNCIIKSI